VLALAGFWSFRRAEDRLWRVWAVSALGMLALLAAKLHHEYYWLALAPVMAVGVGKALVGLAGHGVRGKGMAGVMGLGLVTLSVILSASTWRTPAEWSSLDEAAEAVRAVVPRTAWVVAPEALLFASDRRGCRLEFTGPSARRAAREWGETLSEPGPIGLVEFYRRRGASHFADVAPERPGPDRLALHAAVRRRYKVLRDRPGVLIASLNDPPVPEDASHGLARRAQVRARAGAGRHDPGLRPLEAAGPEDQRADGL
jgi:hypothetical protein